MSKTYHLKLTGSETIDIPEDEFRLVEDDVYKRADKMIRAGGMMFSARDVRRVTSAWSDKRPDYYQEERPEITEEQRQVNLRRMRWIRTYVFSKQRMTTSLSDGEKEGYAKFVDWYESPTQVERRVLKKEFRTVFFDIYFKDHEEMNYCFQAWLPFHDGNRDPRDYKRSDHTPEALGLRDANSLLNQAKEIFGVKAA